MPLLTSVSADMRVEKKWKEKPQRPSMELSNIWIQTQNTWL